MKIAVIAHAHYPIKLPYVGGLEAHTHQLVAELVRRGHEVVLFAKAGSQTAATLYPVFAGDARDGTNPRYTAGFRRAMRLIEADGYDLIINNGLNYVPIEVHTTDMPPMITIFHAPAFSNITSLLAVQSPMANRAYLAVSACTAASWQPSCPDLIHVVPNGMDFSEWAVNLRGPDTPRAVWIGRITPEKGTHIAIQACLQAGIPLRIGGQKFNKKYFDEQVEPLLDNPLIEYVGHVDRQGVNELFAEASVALVTPLWDEPFGLVEIEAWGSGTPVAALPNGALPALVRSDVGSLAQSDTPEALVTAMHLAMKADRATCQRYALQNFTLSKMVTTYLALAPEIATEKALGLSWQPA